MRRPVGNHPAAVVVAGAGYSPSSSGRSAGPNAHPGRPPPPRSCSCSTWLHGSRNRLNMRLLSGRYTCCIRVVGKEETRTSSPSQTLKDQMVVLIVPSRVVCPAVETVSAHAEVEI